MNFTYLFLFLGTSLLFAQPDSSASFLEKKCSSHYSLPFFLNENNEDKQLIEDMFFDVGFYDLYFSLDFETEELFGKTVIYARTLENLGQLEFDFSDNMSVDSIYVNSIHHTDFVHQNYRITISLSDSLVKDTNFNVKIIYHGKPASTGFGAFEWANLSTEGKVFWTLSEPYGSREWWPCQDTPVDKADSVYIKVTVPLDYSVASNGLLENVVENTSDREFFWIHRYPIATYLVAIAAAPYIEVNDTYTSETGWSMPLQHFVYPSRHSGTTLEQLDDVKNMLDAFNHYFGDYPFKSEKYGIANFGWGGGMEHQTMTYQGYFYTGLTAHELGHQWFGDNVTCASFHHIWLNEGFASYTEAMYAEWIGGYDAYMAYIESDFFPYSLTTTTPIYVENPVNVSTIFNRTVYDKGACVVHMLRKIIDNDETFFNLLKVWNSDTGFKDSSATTSDLSDFVSDYLSGDYSWFFDDWIYQNYHPVYSAVWEENQNVVTIELSQVQDQSNGFYRMPVPFRLSSSTGDTTIVVLNNEQDQTFTFQLDFTPTTLEIDPEKNILREIQSINKDIIPEEFMLMGNYPNPFNPGTNITFKNPDESAISASIYNSIGQRVRILNTEVFAPGKNNIFWDGTAENRDLMPSGIYLYMLEIKSSKGIFHKSGKMHLIK